MLAGVCALRLLLTGHAPDVADAGLAGAFGALLLLSLLRGRRAPKSTIIALTCATALGVIAWRASIHPDLSWWSLPGWLQPFLALTAVATQSSATKRRIAIAIVGAGGLHGLVAIYQRLVSYPDALARAGSLGLDPEVVASLQSMRPIGLSLSPDLGAAIALATALLAAALLLEKRSKKGSEKNSVGSLRGALLAAALVSAVTVIFARSAGTLLAGMSAAALVGLRLAFLRQRPQPKTMFLVGVGLLSAAAFGFRGFEALRHSAFERLANWEVVARIGIDNPIGVGLARLGPAYLQARPPGANVTTYAHSLPLQWWAELGGLGLLFFLALAAALLTLGVKTLRDKSSSHYLWLLAPAALGARMLIDYDGQVGQTATLMGVLVALAIAPPGLASSDRNDRPPARWAGIAAGLALLVATLPLPSLLERERVLRPFGQAGGAPVAGDVEALLGFADRYPSDPVTGALAATIEISQLESCARPPGCPALERHFLDRTETLLKLRYPGSAVHTARARMALLHGDAAAATRACRAALEQHPGSEEAMVLRLQVAGALNPSDLEPARAHLERWARGPVKERILQRSGRRPAEGGPAASAP